MGFNSGFKGLNQNALFTAAVCNTVTAGNEQCNARLTIYIVQFQLIRDTSRQQLG